MAMPKILADIREVIDESITATSAVVDGTSIVLTLPTTVSTGSIVKFQAPCDCSSVTTIKIGGISYEILDTRKNNPSNSWVQGSMVSIILDCTSNKAYLSESNKLYRTTFTLGKNSWNTYEEYFYQSIESSNFTSSGYSYFVTLSSYFSHEYYEAYSNAGIYADSVSDDGSMIIWARKKPEQDFDIIITRVPTPNAEGDVYNTERFWIDKESLNEKLIPDHRATLSNPTMYIPAGRMVGDVDGDGEITVADKALMLEFDSGLKKPTDIQNQCRDLNGDGSKNPQDALIAEYIARGTYKLGKYSSDVLGNWTVNPNYETEDAQFYTDIPMSGMTAGQELSIIIGGKASSKIIKTEAIDGAIRVWATSLPIEPLPIEIVSDKVKLDFSNMKATGITKFLQSDLPVGGSWFGITYGNGRFVAVANGKSISIYSDDGINWTQSTLPSSANWKSVIYGNNRFVTAANSSTTAAYSDDGINWIQTTLPVSSNWYVGYGDGKFVAIGGNSTDAAYSTDGITWTATTLPSKAYWNSVCYGDGKFVAVAAGASSTTAAYSTDGITWTAVTLPISAGWESITYGDGKFVAVAQSGNKDKVVYSYDGITWYSGDIFESSWFSITYGDGKFVAVSTSGIISYSYNGIDWISIEAPLKNWSAVSYGNGMFIALNTSNNTALYIDSNNINPLSKLVGDSIVEEIDSRASDRYLSNIIEVSPFKIIESTLPSGAYWNSVTYGNGVYVALDQNTSNKAAYSTDGITWTATTLPSKAYWDSVTYGNGRFVAVASGSGSTTAAYSDDGVTWTAVTLPAESNWKSVAYGNGLFVIVSGDRKTAYSTDGMSWTLGATLTNIASGNWNSITYGNGKFVILSGNNNFAKGVEVSTDGKTWTYSYLPVGAYWTDVVYGNGIFVALDSNGSSGGVYSTDGINWERSTLPSKVDWRSVAYGNGMFVTVSSFHPTGEIPFDLAYSIDGINWIGINNIPDSYKFGCIAYGGGRFIVTQGGNYSDSVYCLEDSLIDKHIDFVINRYASLNKTKSVSVTLSASSWDSSALTQTITVIGVSDNEADQLITPTPAIASQAAYYDAGILCTGQSANSLTFTCTTVPTEDLTVYVVIQEVSI